MSYYLTTFFTNLDNFLPFVIYMVEWSLHNKKIVFSVDQQENSWKTEIRFFFQSLNHVDFYLKPQFLIKSGYYIVPISSTALSKGAFHVKHVENYFVTCQISSLISIFTSNSLKGSIAVKSAILLSNRMWLWKLIWLYMILVGLSSAANVHFATRIRYH